jgi:transposase
MATPARYFDLVREMRDAYNHRLRLVESAKRIGIKPTARLFTTTVPTVHKWLRRFQQRGPSGLVAPSRARHHQAQKTPALTEAQLLQLRKTLPTFGSRRLIREFDLPISHRALERIWREHGLLKKRQKKYPRKQDLAHIKGQWALFQQISADTKDLDDIPHYGAQAQHRHLPVVQYTAREIRSGLLFWAFAQARSASASCSHRASSGIWIVTVSRCATCSGRPTTADSSRGTSRKVSATASTCASPRPRTPTRAMSKPCIAWIKTSSSIWKTSPAAVSSSPKCTPTSCTST